MVAPGQVPFLPEEGSTSGFRNVMFSKKKI
jgi:hypothetical protein